MVPAFGFGFGLRKDYYGVRFALLFFCLLSSTLCINLFCFVFSRLKVLLLRLQCSFCQLQRRRFISLYRPTQNTHSHILSHAHIRHIHTQAHVSGELGKRRSASSRSHQKIEFLAPRFVMQCANGSFVRFYF